MAVTTYGYHNETKDAILVPIGDKYLNGFDYYIYPWSYDMTQAQAAFNYKQNSNNKDLIFAFEYNLTDNKFVATNSEYVGVGRSWFQDGIVKLEDYIYSKTIDGSEKTICPSIITPGYPLYFLDSSPLNRKTTLDGEVYSDNHALFITRTISENIRIQTLYPDSYAPDPDTPYALIIWQDGYKDGYKIFYPNAFIDNAIPKHIVVEVQGAGGGGGCGFWWTAGGKGGGGGSGGYACVVLSLERNLEWTIQLGAGGAGGIYSKKQHGADGGNSYVKSYSYATRETNTYITIGGGKGGKHGGSWYSEGQGGDGGTCEYSSTATADGKFSILFNPHEFKYCVFKGATGGTRRGQGGSYNGYNLTTQIIDTYSHHNFGMGSNIYVAKNEGSSAGGAAGAFSINGYGGNGGHTWDDDVYVGDDTCSGTNGMGAACIIHVPESKDIY